MKTLLTLCIIFTSLCADAAFYQYQRFTTNLDGTLIDGGTLTNIAGTSLGLVPGSNITFTTNGNAITIASTGGGGGLGYTIDLFDTANQNMVANTTYFFGKMSARLLNTTYGIAQIDVPKAGTIKRVQFKYDNSGGGTPSGEQVLFAINLNNSGTAFGFLMAITNAFTNVVVTSSQAVSVGDTIALELVTPSTWTTPATAVRLVAQVYIE